MDAISHVSPRPSALKAAYDAGYSDAVVLLRREAGDCVSAEPVERVHARYLGYVAVKHPTQEARAYIAGFGDAAADNLPCSSHAIPSEAHPIAA
jgi:hypothetical protein